MQVVLIPPRAVHRTPSKHNVCLKILKAVGRGRRRDAELRVQVL
jgi:hypothetical protein